MPPRGIVNLNMLSRQGHAGEFNVVRRLGEVLQTIGGYGFHMYEDGGARWITIRYETEDAARTARDLIAKALAGAISVTVHG
jgi:hypothetical protein